MDHFATRHERSILTMIAAGYTDSVVARRHNVGKRTLERQLAHLMARVGAPSRLALGAIAAQLRWIDVDELIENCARRRSETALSVSISEYGDLSQPG